MKSFAVCLMAACLSSEAQAVKLSANTIPDQFNTVTLGDPFMETVVMEYSVSDKGHYYVPYDKAKALAFQVLTLDAGMSDGGANGTIGDFFDKFWAHYDVLSEGRIAVS